MRARRPHTVRTRALIGDVGNGRLPASSIQLLNAVSSARICFVCLGWYMPQPERCGVGKHILIHARCAVLFNARPCVVECVAVKLIRHNACTLLMIYVVLGTQRVRAQMRIHSIILRASVTTVRYREIYRGIQEYPYCTPSNGSR